MVTMGSLWLAVLLSAAGVWVASAIVWMLLPHHRSDYRGLPDEEGARTALGPQQLTPGQYNIPNVAKRSEIKNPDVVRKFDDGPVAFLTVLPNGLPSLGRSLVLTFIYYLVVGILVAYLASRTVAAGAEYLTVFRVTGTVAWIAYGVAVTQDAIWFGRPWSAVVKQLFDALIYGLVTAGFFSWLWPQA
jgi:hypothetical protein